MSKSLGNFFTIREVLEQFSPETIRFLMLSTHYRSPLDYSDERLKEAETALKRFYNTFHDVERLQTIADNREQAGGSEQESELSELPERMADLKQAFDEAMDDDFNTAAAIGFLFDMLKAINAAVRIVSPENVLSAELLMPLTNAVSTVKTLGAVLGLTFSEVELTSEADQGLVDQLMSFVLDIRKEARANKNWALADRIRDGLSQLGIQVKDHPGGESSWELKT
jgi:cysteinyl-tRNA synthetase